MKIKPTNDVHDALRHCGYKISFEFFSFVIARDYHFQIFRIEGKAGRGALAVIAVGRTESNNRNRKRTCSLKVERSN